MQIRCSKTVLLFVAFSYVVTLLGICFEYSTQAADGNCPGTCEGKWVIVPHSKTEGVPNPDVEQAGTAVAGKQTAVWRITGSKGTFEAYAKVANLPQEFLETRTNAEAKAGLKSATGYKKTKVESWEQGNGKAGCKHGVPDGNDAVVGWSGTGVANATGDGDADEIGGPDATAGLSSINATATAAFSGLESKDVQVQANAQKLEGSPISGKIKVSIGGTFIPELEVEWTVTENAYLANPAVQQITVGNTFTGAILGKWEMGKGVVSVEAKVSNKAKKANAYATTQIFDVDLTVENGGTHSTCCNNQKPHGGHGSKTDPEVIDP